MTFFGEVFLLIYNSLIYISSSILSKSFPFLLLPLVTRLLPPEEFGKASIILLFFSVSNAFVYSNTSTYLAKNYHGKNKIERDKIISDIISYNCFTCVVFSFLALIFVSLSQENFTEFGFVIAVMPLVSLFFSFYQVYQTINRFGEKPIAYAKGEILYSIIGALIGVGYIFYIGKSWEYQFWAIFCSVILLGVFSLIKLMKYHGGNLRYENLKPMFFFCAPLSFHLLGTMSLALADRLIIERIIGAQELGIYVASYSLGMIMSVIVDAYTRAYSPYIYRVISDKKIIYKGKINTKLRNVFSISLILMLLLSSLFYVICYNLYYIFVGESYQSGRDIFGYIVAGIFFQSIYKLIFPFMIKIGSTFEILVINVVSAIINVILNFVLIPIYGLSGAAFATLISYSMVTFLSLLRCILGFNYLRRGDSGC